MHDVRHPCPEAEPRVGGPRHNVFSTSTLWPTGTWAHVRQSAVMRRRRRPMRHPPGRVLRRCHTSPQRCPPTTGSQPPVRWNTVPQRRRLHSAGGSAWSPAVHRPACYIPRCFSGVPLPCPPGGAGEPAQRPVTVVEDDLSSAVSGRAFFHAAGLQEPPCQPRISAASFCQPQGRRGGPPTGAWLPPHSSRLSRREVPQQAVRCALAFRRVRICHSTQLSLMGRKRCK